MGLISVLMFLLLFQASLQAPRLRTNSQNEVMNRSNDYENQDLDKETNHVQYQDAGSGSASGEDLDSFNRDQEENSVDQVIKKYKVEGLPQNQVYSNIPNDSVSSYIAHEDGNLRNEIPESNDDDDDVNDGSNVESGDDTLSKVSDTESVVTGKTKDTISKAEPNDSVAPYIDTNNGLPRNEIAKNEVEEATETGQTKSTITNAEPNREKDSVSSYIDIDGGSRRNEIAQNEDGEKEEDEETETSKKDSVAPYINLVDHNQESQTPTEADDTEVDTVSGDVPDTEEKVGSESSNSKEILEGLENLSLKTNDHKEANESKGMQELSPDMIEAHKMVGELWQERTTEATLQMANSTLTYSYPQQPLYTQPPVYIPPQYTYVSLKFAERKGALCLDGSTPGFFYRRGSGQGVRKWIIYLQGGAWCDSKMDCYKRSKSNLGSSLKVKNLVNVEGILSRNAKDNPHFYDWNAVYVPYCDGASYTGNRSEPVKVQDRMIYFRGKRIISALLDDLLESGLNQAERVIFSGTSAGGLAVLLNADYVRQRIPSNVHVYSLADAGVFLDVANLKKEMQFGHMMRKVYKLHSSSGSINPQCASQHSKTNAWKCLFPYHFGEYINSPVFIVNPLYDSWQLGNVVGIHCVSDLNKCTKTELRAIVDFRKQTLKHMAPLMKNAMVGLFADGCFDHGQIIFGPKWNKIRVRNRSMSGTFFRWIMNEENAKSVIDPDSEEHLFNPTCVTHQVNISKKSFMHKGEISKKTSTKS